MIGKRRAFLLIILVLIASLTIAACGGGDDDGGPRKLFDGGVTVELPGGWTIDEEGASGGQVMLYSSKKIRTAESADDLPDNAALGTILVGPVYDFELEGGPEESLRSYLELESDLPEDAVFEAFEIDGNPATRYTGTEEQNGLQGYNYDVAVFFDGQYRMYLLMVGLGGDEGDFKETFDKIAESLTVDTDKLAEALPES